MPSRRRLLLVAGSAVATVGCLDRSTPGTAEDGAGTTPGRDRRTETTRDARTSDGVTTTQLRSIRVQSSYVGVGSGGIHAALVARPGEQYVLVRTGGGSDPPRVAVRLDGETYPGSEEQVFATIQSSASTIPVALPRSVDPDEGAVVVGGREQALSGRTLDRLANPPTFEVTGVSIPATASPTDGFPVELTVAHRGGRDGTFRATVTTECFSGRSVVEASLSAGETATVRENAYGCTGGSTVDVDWRGGPRQLTVPAPGSPTTTD